MKFDLSVKMDNAAFEDSAELPRILRQIAKQIEEHPESERYVAMDVNGNFVGTGRISGHR